MHEWLLPEIDAGATVVTASRRLSRALAAEYADARVAAGDTAWATPRIASYGQWLTRILDEAAGESAHAPYRLSAAQSRVLWEVCIAEELGPDHANLAGIVRAASEAWSLMHAFCVPRDALDQSIENRDQGAFARASKRYAGVLESRNWIDDATAAVAVEAALGKGSLSLPPRLVFAGFDRITPRQERLIRLARDARVPTMMPEPPAVQALNAIAAEDRSAELRAAGAWARDHLLDHPGERVAIVVTGLERDPVAAGRLVREGFTPGWQTAPGTVRSLVNVSLGAPLDSFPLIGVALLLVRWLHAPLTSRQLGVLLRCPFLGVGDTDSRARLELGLRQIAARDWTPARVLRVFTQAADDATSDFLARIDKLDELAGKARGRATPATWARHFDAALGAMGWPGSQALSSDEQQLVNRWRDLLNELSHLEVVTGAVSGSEAAELLRSTTRDTVFQPEDTGSAVSVLGPLEAAGLEFDAIRVTGLNAGNWPAASRPTPLLSRRLAREYGLPDSSPEDTLVFARTVLARLSGSAPLVTGSYSLTDGESELGPTLVPPVTLAGVRSTDPGWYAAQCRSAGRLGRPRVDSAPPVDGRETIRGGAGTLDAQLSEPFAAFARGRLGVSSLDPFAEGLTALMRGNLIHDALSTLYDSLPSQSGIRAWSHSDRRKRIDAACHRAIVRHRVAAGRTLERLLDFEERRLATLLNAVIELDLGRPPFRILSVEGTSSGTIGGLELRLRHDRIDEAEDGSLVILDYKTGRPKKFLEKGVPRDYQLVVYAATVARKVSDLGLFNVDSRDVAINGVGVTLSGNAAFEATLGDWIHEVETGAAMLRAGDVRVNQLQGAEDARAYGLLSRYAELVRAV